VIVTAPAICSSVAWPWSLSSGIDAFVTIGVLNSPVTFESDPQEHVTARD
jgi:hypothetical protein